MNILLFLPRWIITTAIWVCVWLPFYILGYLVVWVGLLFCDRDSEHMPKLWWPWCYAIADAMIAEREKEDE